MKLIFWAATLTSLSLWASTTAPSNALRCGGGGEGPKPLADVSASFSSTLRILPTEGSVKDFLFWDNHNTLVYRNESDKIFGHQVEPGYSWQINRSSQPLSQVVDEKERYLVTEHTPWFLDVLKNAGWLRYASPAPMIQPLFWHKAALYSIATYFNTSGQQSVQLYRYEAGAAASKEICPGLQFEGDAGYHIGRGNAYPYLFMHRVVPTPNGNELTVFRLNVKSCRVEDLATYNHLIQGTVQAVHWFDMGAIAVKIDHPTHNLLWDTGLTGCRYFNVGAEMPMVLNYHHPVLASWKRGQGLSLFYLNAEKKAEVLRETSIQKIDSQDLWLTEDGRRLFLAPILANRTKLLMELNLPPVP